MKLLLAFILIFIGFSCAQIVSPSGGTKDTESPVVDQKKTEPKNFSTQFNSKTIEIEFNEYFNLSNPSKNIIITPTLDNQPDFLVKNKRLIIDLNNDLAENTTYSINFGESISDITEGNILKNYKYVFSTGDVLDSLELKGYIYNARTKKPIQDAAVMLYINHEDSIPLKQKPYYFTKTIKSGWFNISNIKAGDYKLVAISETNNDLIYNSNEELIAFSDTLVSINKPDSTAGAIKLYAFQEIEDELYVKNKKYRFNRLVSIQFNKPPTEKLIAEFYPKVEFETYHYPNTDSIQYYLKENILVEKLILTDGDFIDTVRLRQDKSETQFMSINLPRRKLSQIDTLTLKLQAPIDSINKNLISLKEDSTEINFKIITSKRSLYILFEKETDKFYDLTLNDSAISDKSGYVNDSSSYSIFVPLESYFSTITLELDSLDNSNFILELIRKKKILSSIKIKGNQIIEFPYLRPGEYKVRLIEDLNNNGRWDTGNYLNKQHAERVIYFHKTITTRSNWDVNEAWSVELD